MNHDAPPPENERSQNDLVLQRLKDEMEQTKALFEGAKLEYSRSLERSQELGMSHPDGSLQHAMKVYTYTLTNYRIALRCFTRFLLDGRMPVDEDRSQAD